MRRAKLQLALLVTLSLILGYSSLAQGVPEPAFHWAFNEGAGTIAHDLAGNNDGIVEGTQWVTGYYGSALLFDGVNDHVQLPDDSLDVLGSSFTICAWVYRDITNQSTHEAILGYSHSESIGKYLHLSILHDHLLYYARLSEDSSDNDCMYRGDTILGPNQWFHVALVVDGTTAKAYINGAPENFKKQAGSDCPNVYGFVDIANIASKATIGVLQRSDGYVMDFKGIIDELMVFDKAMTAYDISLIYGHDETLVAHWKLDEGNGEIAYDSSGENDGMIHGAKWAGGITGNALNFNGNGDYVEVPDSNSLNITEEVTLAAWIKILGDTKAPRIIAKGGESDYKSPYGIILDVDAKYLIGCIGDGIYWNLHTYTEEPLIWGTWYHVAMSYSTSAHVLKLYLNGEEVLSVKETAALISTEYPLSIGALKYRGNWQNFFDGCIDDVRIYDRQLTPEEILQLTQIKEALTYHVDIASGNDDNDGFTKQNAFKTIQRAIDAANYDDTVLVWPGLYLGPIDFMGKAITVRSAADAATIMGLWENAVTMQNGEGPGSVLQNFVITNSQAGIVVANESAPTLTNLTIVWNGMGIVTDDISNPTIANCILWANSDGDLIGCDASYSWIGQQHIAGQVRGGDPDSGIPGFADPDNGDYHLLSERGRYWPEYDIWVLDKETSPCVDAGDPQADVSDEPAPNGGRINIGAYGGTAYASMNEPPVIMGDLNRDGAVNFADLALMATNWLATESDVAEQEPPDTGGGTGGSSSGGRVR